MVARTLVSLPVRVMVGLLVGYGHAGIVFIQIIKVAIPESVDAVVTSFGVLHIILTPAEQHDHSHPHRREFTGPPHNQTTDLLVFDTKAPPIPPDGWNPFVHNRQTEPGPGNTEEPVHNK